MLAVLFLAAAGVMGAGREVAITIDDSPRGGDGGARTIEAVRAMTARLLAPFREQKIPVIGFVNEGRKFVPYLESVIAFFEQRSVEVVGHEFPQKLLLHANQLNAEMMPDILAMLRRRGYTFVTLDHALKDDAYRLADEYAGTGGFSWIHRWSMTKKMPNKGEPDEPELVRKAYLEITRRKSPAPE